MRHATSSDLSSLRSVWLIIPTYNEAENIKEVLAAVSREMRHDALTGLRVLIVDDSSPDGTGAIAEALAATNAHIEVIHRTQKEGIGPAYLAGFRHALAAGADLVVQMDADLSHDPADIIHLVAGIDAGADLTLGSRYVSGGATSNWGLTRRLISNSGCSYARAVLGLPFYDLTGGFKCWRREALEGVELETIQSRGYVFQVEMTFRAAHRDFTVVEVPIIFSERVRGYSKMSARIAIEAAWRLPQLRFRHSRVGCFLSSSKTRATTKLEPVSTVGDAVAHQPPPFLALAPLGKNQRR
jgi:dolichol-phosphate mannosyltransferase